MNKLVSRNPIQRFKQGRKITKFQKAGKLSPATPVNRLNPNSNTVQSMPEIISKGVDRRWHFDTRESNHGNGYGVKSQTFFDYYDGGDKYLGDSSPIRGGRTIYISPKGNDTLYWRQPSEWIHYQHGFMPVGGNQPGAKANFFKNLKRPLIKNKQGGLIPIQNLIQRFKNRKFN